MIEINIGISKDDMNAIDWLDMRFNPLSNDEDIWIPQRSIDSKRVQIKLL